MAIEQLANGAYVLDRKLNADGHKIVLCFMPDNTQKWVSWVQNVSSGIDFYWGHYFSDLEAAVKDFKTR
jgi:hypothetical protein